MYPVDITKSLKSNFSVNDTDKAKFLFFTENDKIITKNEYGVFYEIADIEMFIGDYADKKIDLIALICDILQKSYLEFKNKENKDIKQFLIDSVNKTIKELVIKEIIEEDLKCVVEENKVLVKDEDGRTIALINPENGKITEFCEHKDINQIKGNVNEYSKIKYELIADKIYQLLVQNPLCGNYFFVKEEDKILLKDANGTIFLKLDVSSGTFTKEHPPLVSVQRISLFIDKDKNIIKKGKQKFNKKEKEELMKKIIDFRFNYPSKKDIRIIDIDSKKSKIIGIDEFLKDFASELYIEECKKKYLVFIKILI